MKGKLLSVITAFAMTMTLFPSTAGVRSMAAEVTDPLPEPAYHWDFENVSNKSAANKGTAGDGNAILEGTAKLETDMVTINGRNYKNEGNRVLSLSGGAKGTSYVSLPSDLYRGVTADTGVTYSFWLKPDRTVGSYSRVISSADSGSGNEFAFAPYASDKVWNVLFDDTNIVRAPMASEPVKDEWSFVVVTINEDQVTFYINGEEKGSYEDMTNLPIRLDCMPELVNNALGKTCSGWSDPDAKVKLDDLCLYKTALTRSEAVRLARAQGFDVEEKPETTEYGGANELTDGTGVTDVEGLAVSHVVSGSGISAKIVEDRETGRYFITAARGDDVILDASQIGAVTSLDFTQGMSYVEDSAETVEGKDAYTLTTGAKRVISDPYKELSFQLKKNGTEKIMTVYVRVYKDGIAYRYEWRGEAGQSEKINREASEFVLPADSVIWAGYDDGGNYEYEYRKMKMSFVKAAEDKYCVPLLANSGKNWMLFTEAAVFSEKDTYCASHLATKKGSRNLKFAFGRGSGSSVSMVYNEKGIIRTPWRVAMMSDDLNDIVNATMTSSLNPAADPTLYQDGSQWIKTGTVAWSWWSEAGDDPIEYDQQKDYIDFAAENGWEYVCLDFGWCLWTDYKEKVKELVEYGKEKGVGILLWYGVNNDNHAGFKDAQGNAAYPKYSLKTAAQLEEQFAWCQETGIRGVKVDYYEKDDKGTMTQMYDCATIAAKHKLNVLFHGCTAPRGEIRTFPNVLGYEAVRGSEWYKWDIGPSVSNCLLYVFNRNVVGGMDFTPVGTQISQLPVTAGFQLAQVIAYQTGLQNIASSVYKLEGYKGLSMISDVPAQWDETKLLNGEPGKKVVIARRAGEDWYIGAMTAADGKEIITLDFLGEGTYKAYLYQDNDKGTDIEIELKEVTRESVLELPLAANGGAAVKITKENMKTDTVYDNYIYYEAEDEENTRSGNAAVGDNQFASGMKQVTGVGGTAYNKLTFNKINAAEDGIYEMRLYYACGVPRRVVYSINGGDEIRSGRLNAGVNTLAMQKFYVRLKQGDNTIFFGNPLSKAPNIDRIAISKKTTNKPATETDLTDDGEKPIDGTQYDYTVYGAQTAVLAGGARLEGGAISWLGANAACKAIFKVKAERAGTYKLQLNYFAGETRDVDVSVNGGGKIRCSCPSTGSYAISSADSIYVNVTLKAGENTIELGNDSAWCPNIVSIGISKTVVEEKNPSPDNDKDPSKDPIQNPAGDQDTAKDPSAAAKSISVKVKGYQISKITLVKGSKITLKTSVTPGKADQKVTYKSSKKFVASVSASGVVTAKKVGKAKITIATSDKKKKKTVSIQVVKKRKQNRKLTLKKKSVTMKKKGQTSQIQVKSLTKGTTDKITYKVTSGKKYIKVDAYGQITVKKFKKKQQAVVRVRCGKAQRKIRVRLKK